MGIKFLKHLIAILVLSDIQFAQPRLPQAVKSIAICKQEVLTKTS